MTTYLSHVEREQSCNEIDHKSISSLEPVKHDSMNKDRVLISSTPSSACKLSTSQSADSIKLVQSKCQMTTRLKRD